MLATKGQPYRLFQSRVLAIHAVFLSQGERFAYPSVGVFSPGVAAAR